MIRQPLGPVGVITPWNFPIFIPAFKIAAALLHGNTVVWKPASLTPIAAKLLVDTLVDADLPPGVVNPCARRRRRGWRRSSGTPDVAAVSSPARLAPDGTWP